MLKKMLFILFFLFVAVRSYAAVGCTLNDPDRDVRRLFPRATNYTTEFISIKEVGGDSLKDLVEEQLDDVLEPNFEAIDVPYAYYTILNGKEIIGYIHGVNQKGMYGGMQLILASTPAGVIQDFYYQKISSPEAKKFRSDVFTKQFISLTLNDFLDRDLCSEFDDPSENSEDDYTATIRGLRKNMILLHEFKLNRAIEKE